MASNNNIMCWALFEIYSLYKLILTIGPYEISTITFILRCENWGKVITLHKSMKLVDGRKGILTRPFGYRALYSKLLKLWIFLLA